MIKNESQETNDIEQADKYTHQSVGICKVLLKYCVRM